jgi:hypothetical protein
VDHSVPIVVSDVERLALCAITERPQDAVAVLEIVENELRKRRALDPADHDEIARMDALKQRLQQVIASAVG